jgi:hypothetical protein
MEFASLEEAVDFVQGQMGLPSQPAAPDGQAK